MNKRMGWALLLAAALVCLVVGQTAAAPVTRTSFTGTATTLWLDMGEWTTLPNGVTVVQLLTHEDLLAASDARLDGGLNLITVYAKLDAEGNGHMWGTFSIQMPDGAWEGVFTGDVVAFWQGGFVARAHGQGHGAYDGQLLKLVNNTGSLSGEIIVP